MKRVVALLWALLATVPAAPTYAADFIKLDEIHVSTRPASSRGDIFWVSNYPLTTPVPMVRNTWNVIDVASLGLPADTKAIFVSGMLILTYSAPPGSETANLKVAFRAFGDTSDISSCITCQWYLGQAIETAGGQRSTWATWIPVTDGKFEMRFECTQGHLAIAAVSACGVNLSVQAWGR